jgi:hypothetical protein
MGPVPLRAWATEQALAGGAGPRDAAALAGDGTSPPGDNSASPGYREHLARVPVRRALEVATARAPSMPGVAARSALRSIDPVVSRSCYRGWRGGVPGGVDRVSGEGEDGVKPGLPRVPAPRQRWW